MTDKIQFACSHCGSTLAVPVVYVGKKAKCPVCSSPIMVPASGTGGQEGVAGPEPASDTPWSSAAPATQDAASSARPSNSLFDELDSLGAASGQPLPPASASRDRMRADATTASGGGLGYQADAPATTSTGRSIAGLAAAMGVGLAAMIVWLVLAAMSGYELGILAWGIGALIGLVSGVIARNPSPAFCAMVAVIAMGAILSAKLVMALAIVAIHFFSTKMEEFVLPPVYDKYSHAYVDQVLADNYFVGDQKRFAIELNADYFEPRDEEDLEAQEEGEAAKTLTEVQQEIDDQLRREFYRLVRQRVDNATDEEKATWLANAHQRHPAWIEDHSHYQAAVIELMAQPGQLDADLTAHAQYSLSFLNNDGSDYDEAYSENITPAEYNRRDGALNLKCAEFLRTKSPAEIESLLRQGLQKYPAFAPYPEAFTATLDKMVLDGSLDPALQAHAKLYLDTELGPEEEMAYYDAERTPEFVATDTAMRQAVNASLATMDEAARKAAVRETGARHPTWYAVTEDTELPDMAEMKKDLGDGTFVGSLKMVFGVYDLLWLFLGATTAYGTAMRRGKRA
jgi:DNA-directed RNA polymerase subunit RPC12/RpoP